MSPKKELPYLHSFFLFVSFELTINNNDKNDTTTTTTTITAAVAVATTFATVLTTIILKRHNQEGYISIIN